MNGSAKKSDKLWVAVGQKTLIKFCRRRTVVTLLFPKVHRGLILMSKFFFTDHNLGNGMLIQNCIRLLTFCTTVKAHAPTDSGLGSWQSIATDALFCSFSLLLYFKVNVFLFIGILYQFCSQFNLLFDCMIGENVPIGRYPHQAHKQFGQKTCRTR